MPWCCLVSELRDRARVACARKPISGRGRGSIDELPTGAYGVRVYAGVDPITTGRQQQIRWSISGIDEPTDCRRGAAATLSQAWLAALSAGRAALLAGQLPNLAAYINLELKALLSPAAITPVSSSRPGSPPLWSRCTK